MAFKSKVAISMEAIRHFNDLSFVDKIVSAIQFLKDQESYNRDDIVASGIEKIIFDRFGYNVELRIEEVEFLNAYVLVPDVNTNHSMINYNRRDYFNGKDALRFLKQNKLDVLTGTYDTGTGRVTGDYTKLVSKITLFSGLFHFEKYNARHIAAILLHEVGHISSYFENMIRVLTTNLVLEAVCTGFLETSDVQIKAELIRAGAKHLNVNKVEVPDVTKLKDKEIVASVLINAAVQEPQSLLGSVIHDMRSFEQSADQFVVRAGLGVELGQALDTLGGVYGDPAKMNIVSWTIFNTMISIYITAFSPLILPLMLLFGEGPDMGDYDNLPNRIKRIKQDAISSLRDRKMTNADTKRVLADIDALDSLLSGLKGREFFFMKIFRLASSKWRSQKEIMERQKIYEDLANNSLYVASAKLKTINMESAAPLILDENFEDGTEREQDLLEQYETLFKNAEALETLNRTNDPALESYREREAALEESFIGIIAAAVLGLASLIYAVYQFFTSDKLTDQAAGYVADIKSHEDSDLKVTHDTVENSDTMTEYLEIPAIATAFDPHCAPNTAKLLDDAVNMLDKLASRSSLKKVDNIDKMLERADKMTDEQKAKELAEIEEDFLDFSNVLSDFDALAKELGVDAPEFSGNSIGDGKLRAKFFSACIAAIGSPNKNVKVNSNALTNLHMSKVYKTASECQTMLAKFQKFAAEGDDIAKKLKVAGKKIQRLDSGSDVSVKHVKAYVDLNQNIITIILKLGKVLIIRLKGQRDVVNLLSDLKKDEGK